MASFSLDDVINYINNKGIEGPFQQTKFCGASVIDIQGHGGFQEQGTNVQVNLVEADNDVFIAPTAGTPKRFQFGKFIFDGLVQRYTRNNSVGGFTYTVNLASPTEILENVKILLDAYRGQNKICPNLLNVYGYLERGGANFGGSKKNESGIPWYLIRDAILAIQDGSTPYSNPVEFKGHTYIFDLSNVPETPDFYRIGVGLSASMGQIISQVFLDSGFEHIVYLETVAGNGPHIIRFKARDRRNATPLGQIEAFVSGRDDIVSWEAGVEVRNDVTCGVLFGGSLEEIIPQFDTGNGETIYPYWGESADPNLIPFGGSNQGNRPLNPSDSVDGPVLLDASTIADLVGDPNGANPPTYLCSIMEMRFALESFDAWSGFIVRKRPDVAAIAGYPVFPSVYGNNPITNDIQSLFSGNGSTIGLFSDRYGEEVAMENLQRIYSFVSGVAGEYLGRQFLVKIPFLLKYYFEEETNNVFYNMYPSNEGYWPDYIGGDSGPLGLNYLNFNYFSSDNGKFTPYVRFAPEVLVNADIDSLSPDNYLIQDNGLFMKCSIDSRIMYTPAPAVLITLAEPLWSLSPDAIGGVDDVAAVLGATPLQLRTLLQTSQNSEFKMRLHPYPYRPLDAAICLKSDEMSYGPWSNIGVPGDVDVRQDTELVPWNYGGFETMNAAAEAQLANIGTTSQEEESGNVVVAGAPELSLHDQLNGVGPVVNSIDITVGPGGVTTTYRMLSQTPSFGRFSRSNAERIRRLGRSTQEMRRTIRAIYNSQNTYQQTLARGGINRAVLGRRSAAIQQQEVHGALHGQIVSDGNGNFYHQISSQSLHANIGNTNAHDSGMYQRTASIGYEGVFKPFSTNVQDTAMAHFTPATGVSAGSIFTTESFNPYKVGSALLWAIHGSGYNGMYTGANQLVDRLNMRLLGLNGPVTIVGYGVDVAGNPCPNAMSGKMYKDFSSGFAPNYMGDVRQHKAGLVDLAYDVKRGVWTDRGILRGKMMESITTGQTNKKMHLEAASDGDYILVSMDYHATIASGTLVKVGYEHLTNKWWIISADCPGA